MMRRTLKVLVIAMLAITGCEDGPKSVYNPPSDEIVDIQNGGGSTAPPPFFPEGEAGYTSDTEGGDAIGRAQFCSVEEHEAVVQELVLKPMIPDVSLGGVPMWAEDGTPMHADDLLGLPEDGGFCDPTIYSNALTWGPTNEIIAFIDTETRLIESLAATQQFLGTLSGEYTNPDGDKVSMTIRMRDRIMHDGVEWDQYTSRDEQENKPRAWANYANVNILYRLIREEFFDSAPIDYDFDCVEAKVCNLIYDSEEAQEVRQQIVLYIIDSGVIFVFSPEGNITWVQLEQVRVAPFEAATSLKFGDEGSDTVAPLFSSSARPGCELQFGTKITWADFKATCIGDDDRTLGRVNYNVYAQRDSVGVEFSGIDLAFLRDVADKGVFADGERPDDEDELYSITITRQLNSPFQEFVPADLAAAYKIKLKERLAAAVDMRLLDPVEPPMEGEEPAAPSHPILDYDPAVPNSLADEASPIEQLFYQGRSGTTENWNNTVIRDLREIYNGLTSKERAAVSKYVAEPTWIIEPYVETILAAFSHGRIYNPGSYLAFRNTDDKRWVIGYAHFIQDGVPYRLTAQYSLNYGALTAVTISYGYSVIDDVLNIWNNVVRPSPGLGQDKFPYFGVDLARVEGNPFGIGGDGIRIRNFDRKLGTMDIQLKTLDASNDATLLDMTVTGDPIEDRNGYMRQIRGERFEFVPANVVRLSGKETSLLIYVNADNRITRVAQSGFKSPVTLCPGLNIRYGDNIRDKINAWIDSAGVGAYRECEVLFNYSENGNVLDSIVSLTNRVRFVTVNERAVQADIWE